MEPSSKRIHCVVVTPEKTELDVTCDFLTLPLFDGELGVLPGRAPMVGRLGNGILKVRTGSTDAKWLLEGGFVQVTRTEVNVLTNRVSKSDSAS